MICGLASCLHEVTQIEDVTTGDDYPAFSPDGKHIAYTRTGQDLGLYIIDNDGSNKRLLLPVLYNEECESPSWSPDGQWLVFSKGHFLKLFMCKINGDSLKELTDIDSTDREFRSPSWSRDNTRIVFVVPHTLKNGGDVYQTSIDFTNSKMLFDLGPFITAGGDTEISPDGKHLIFYRGIDNNGATEIFISDDLGNQKARLTYYGDRINLGPTWSPDSQKIAWSSDDVAGSAHLCTMNADGTNQKEIGFGSNPSWSVNDEIVFSDRVQTSADKNYRYWKRFLYIVSPMAKSKDKSHFKLKLVWLVGSYP